MAKATNSLLSVQVSLPGEPVNNMSSPHNLDFADFEGKQSPAPPSKAAKKLGKVLIKFDI